MAPEQLRIVEANGIRHTVSTAGAPTSPAVLLLHGLGWDRTLWTELAGLLAGAGYRVIAPDLRGMGTTDKPQTPYTIAGYAADQRALLDALGITCAAVVGFSLGGMVAAALALSDRRVGALVLACCTVSSTPEGEAATEAMLARAQLQGPLAFAREQAERVWHPAWAARHPDRVADFIAWRAAMDQVALHRAFRSSYGTDLAPDLGRLSIPVRVVAADQDPFASLDDAVRLASMLPGADLVMIAPSGHMAAVEQPEAFGAAILSFLSRSLEGAEPKS